MKQEKDEIDKSFENFLTEAPEKPTVDPKLIKHILEMSDKSPKDQFLLLGSISNYNTSTSLKEEGSIIHVKNITYAEHVFYDDKFSKTGLDGERIQTYIPSSPRNRIMYFMDTGKEGELFQLVKHILKEDQANETDGHTIKMDHLLYQGKKENIHHALFQYHNAQSLQQLGQILTLNTTVLTQIAPFTSCLKNNLSLKGLSNGGYMSKVKMSA